MASPSCKCLNTWRGSFFVYDATLNFEDDGTIQITTCDPITGNISGYHYDAAGHLDGQIQGSCHGDQPHFRFTRETIINGVPYVVTYHGDIADTPIGPVIIRGRFKKRPKSDPKTASDDGDWTAQGTTTLITDSWRSKS
jgi:hypothetical protein